MLERLTDVAYRTLVQSRSWGAGAEDTCQARLSWCCRASAARACILRLLVPPQRQLSPWVLAQTVGASSDPRCGVHGDVHPAAGASESMDAQTVPGSRAEQLAVEGCILRLLAPTATAQICTGFGCW